MLNNSLLAFVQLAIGYFTNRLPVNFQVNLSAAHPYPVAGRRPSSPAVAEKWFKRVGVVTSGHFVWQYEQ